LGHHGDKRNWKSKGIHKFNGVDPTSKLEELLLSYTMDDKDQILSKELSRLPEALNSSSNSPRKNKKD